MLALEQVNGTEDGAAHRLYDLVLHVGELGNNMVIWLMR
jgi:hypothetical protein